MPATELAAFNRHIARAKEMVSLADFLSTVGPVLDVGDMYRAALVQGVSAFDTFVHAEVRVRMVQQFGLTGALPPAFTRFRVSISSARDALQNASNPASQLNWLDSEIRQQHSLLSFQQPDKVADAVRLVSECKLWDEVAAHLNIPPTRTQSPSQVLKTELALTIDRRNTIVHESDLIPLPPGDVQYPIDKAAVAGVLAFLESLPPAIQAVSTPTTVTPAAHVP